MLFSIAGYDDDFEKYILISTRVNRSSFCLQKCNITFLAILYEVLTFFVQSNHLIFTVFFFSADKFSFSIMIKRMKNALFVKTIFIIKYLKNSGEIKWILFWIFRSFPWYNLFSEYGFTCSNNFFGSRHFRIEDIIWRRNIKIGEFLFFFYFNAETLNK